MKNINILIALFLSLACNAQNKDYTWKGKVGSKENNEIKFAHIQVQADGHYYLFMTNDDGYVEIIYPNFNITDSVLVSSIGYKTKKISCSDLKQKELIILESEIYQIKEAIITPKKYKVKKLGNKNIFTIRSDQIDFNQQHALYIPNRGIEGKVTSVRVYMHDFSEKEWKYRPFRLRLFEGDFPFEKEIIEDKIIASLETKVGHWVEIDLSNFNIDFPQNGILVAIEALPYDYYKRHNYIEHRVVRGRINSFSIGFTADTKTRDELRCYSRYYDRDWKPVKDKNWYYLIQITVQYE